MPLGAELKHHPRLGRAERAYIAPFGAPVNGLRNRLRRLRPLLAERDGSHRYERILDAGCGPGVFSYTLARIHPEAEIVGLDIDADKIGLNREIARRSGLKNCRFVEGDVTRLPEESAYDLAVSVDNLEHIEDDLLALENLHRTLKPGGRLVVHVPGYFRRWFLFRKKVNFYVPTHVRPGYLREQIVSRIERAGFKVEEAFYTYGWLETISNNISYAITGAEKKRKALYALVFPFLLLLSWLGRNARPRWGAGVAVVARKPR